MRRFLGDKKRSIPTQAKSTALAHGLAELHKVRVVAQIGFFSKWQDPHNRLNFKAGLHDALPALVATGTWGFVTGIALVKSGLTESMATLMTLLVYAGSAQLTSLPLIESAAPLWLIFAAGLVVNIRFLIFGAALQPFFRHLVWPKRLGLGFFSTDIAFVLFMGRYGESKEKGGTEQLWYYLGIIVPGWFVWNSFSLLGIYLGALVPASWSLEFAAVLALMAIIVPLVKTRPMAMCLLTAGLIAWLGQPLPLRLGLAAAVLGGVLAGVLGEAIQHRARKG
ncbi:branched-chain amino acid ABC transporter permease [Candidimonas sp. SYP-B2681]|uniref:AzlC family ABC transporter permease n=1 Tax=Candidimonas sp. SYP-B2681 TaxID=2497686 RepID=UPI000F866460|nr:AzlC family ABC transporter permease [Candidimonas sp. SYP-B2681]RTZ42312.1 branched-chain amino acid ABC transporter permease [Candidimonas sp. SYP-B2681]